MLDLYTATNGIITPSTSLVTGYDFVADAAGRCGGRTAGRDQRDSRHAHFAARRVTLDKLDRGHLRQKLFGSRHDIVFMAGHFSAGGLEAADYATSVSAAEVLSSTVDMSDNPRAHAGLPRWL